MKNKYSTTIIVIYLSLFVVSHHAHAGELVPQSKLSSPFFEHVPNEIQKYILKKLVNLHTIPVKDENIAQFGTNLTIWLININQYCKPVKLCGKELSIIDMSRLAPHEKKTVRKIAKPSLVRILCGYSPDIISDYDYADLNAMSIRKTLKSTQVQRNEITYHRICTAATCTCGMLVCCCTPLNTIYTQMAAIFCPTIACFCCAPEACVHCNRLCCDKYINPGLKPQHKKFS